MKGKKFLNINTFKNNLAETTETTGGAKTGPCGTPQIISTNRDKNHYN